MASQKYRGQTTVLMYAPAIDTAPTVDLSGTSRTIEVQEQGNEIDTTTRDDLVEGGQSSLATSPSRTINAQGLDTTPDASRKWHAISVGDLGRAAVYPMGKSVGDPYEIGNVVVTNRNYSSPHDNAPTWQLNFKVNGAWTPGVVA
jgi:hypothetical protein